MSNRIELVLESPIGKLFKISEAINASNSDFTAKLYKDTSTGKNRLRIDLVTARPINMKDTFTHEDVTIPAKRSHKAYIEVLSSRGNKPLRVELTRPEIISVSVGVSNI